MRPQRPPAASTRAASAPVATSHPAPVSRSISGTWGSRGSTAPLRNMSLAACGRGDEGAGAGRACEALDFARSGAEGPLHASECNQRRAAQLCSLAAACSCLRLPHNPTRPGASRKPAAMARFTPASTPYTPAGTLPAAGPRCACTARPDATASPAAAGALGVGAPTAGAAAAVGVAGASLISGASKGGAPGFAGSPAGRGGPAVGGPAVGAAGPVPAGGASKAPGLPAGCPRAASGASPAPVAGSSMSGPLQRQDRQGGALRMPKPSEYVEGGEAAEWPRLGASCGAGQCRPSFAPLAAAGRFALPPPICSCTCLASPSLCSGLPHCHCRAFPHARGVCAAASSSMYMLHHTQTKGKAKGRGCSGCGSSRYGVGQTRGIARRYMAAFENSGGRSGSTCTKDGS